MSRDVSAGGLSTNSAVLIRRGEEWEDNFVDTV